MIQITQFCHELCDQDRCKRDSDLWCDRKQSRPSDGDFGLLILAQTRGRVTLVDRYNYMKLISDGTVLKKSEQFGKYVSFFHLEEM